MMLAQETLEKVHLKGINPIYMPDSKKGIPNSVIDDKLQNLHLIFVQKRQNEKELYYRFPAFGCVLLLWPVYRHIGTPYSTKVLRQACGDGKHRLQMTTVYTMIREKSLNVHWYTIPAIIKKNAYRHFRLENNVE